MGFMCTSLKIGTEVVCPIRQSPPTYAKLFAMHKALIDLYNLIQFLYLEIITLPTLKVIGVSNIRVSICKGGATGKISIRSDPEVPSQKF